MWTNKNFSISIEDVETTFEEIKKIAKREGESTSAIIVKALKDYVKEHGKGNYQTLFKSYLEGGFKSDGQMEQEIFRKFQDKRELLFRDIVSELRRLNYTGRKLMKASEKIMSQLVEEGVKIIR